MAIGLKKLHKNYEKEEKKGHMKRPMTETNDNEIEVRIGMCISNSFPNLFSQKSC